MVKSPFLKSILTFLILVLISVTVLKSDLMYAMELLFIPALTILFLTTNKDKPFFFTSFLVIFSITNIISLFDGDSFNETFYFLCNGLYIIAYIFLFLEIIRTLKVRELIKNHIGQIIILLVLDGFIIYALTALINPINFETNVINYVRFIEHIFNLVLLFVFNISFLNYLQKNNNRALIMFIGCLAITFSEILIIGYYYFSDNEILNVFSIFLMVSAFILFYYQSTLSDDNKSVGFHQ